MNRSTCKGVAILLALSSILYLEKAEAAPSGEQGGRFALVIGNSNYGGQDDVSGIEDAKQMKAALRQIGFPEENIALVPDGHLTKILSELEKFGQRIRQASVVVFFFSGHGFQSGAENFLVPIGGSADPASALPLTTVKKALTWAPNEAVKLVFLDACRTYKKLPPGTPQGLREEQAPSAPRTLYAFAAGPNLSTPAGRPDEVSPYSKVLLNYLNEPGLKITEFLDKVASDSAVAGQLPSYVINGVPSDFRLRDPVFVRAELGNVNGNLLVMVNGDVVLNSGQASSARLPLKSGHNELQLLMSRGKSYHNGHTWDVTEGWGYELKIGLRETGEISCSGPDANGYCFSGEEHHPFKDGPHHGGTFVVAKATLVVDGKAETPRVILEDSDTEVWRREAPAWARDQELLYEASVASLNLTPEDLLSGLNLLPPWDVLLRPIVQQLLTSGTLFGREVLEPKQTFATVWGNQALRQAVQVCMTEYREERISDLKASMAAVFARKDKPFSGFDEGLTACVREKNQDGLWADEEVLIWTAIQDRSKKKGNQDAR